jgi:hypothetical protein
LIASVLTDNVFTDNVSTDTGYADKADVVGDERKRVKAW